MGGRQSGCHHKSLTPNSCAVAPILEHCWSHIVVKNRLTRKSLCCRCLSWQAGGPAKGPPWGALARLSWPAALLCCAASFRCRASSNPSQSGLHLSAVSSSFITVRCRVARTPSRVALASACRSLQTARQHVHLEQGLAAWPQLPPPACSSGPRATCRVKGTRVARHILQCTLLHHSAGPLVGGGRSGGQCWAEAGLGSVGSHGACICWWVLFPHAARAPDEGAGFIQKKQAREMGGCFRPWEALECYGTDGVRGVDGALQC